MTDNPLIIEFFTQPEELSTGLHVRHRPYLRFIYFEVDEDTGAKSVKDILELDMLLHTNGPAYAALHVIDWHNDFDHISFRDNREEGHGEFCEVNRADFATDTMTACRVASYMFHMLWAHCGGYLDYEGAILQQQSDDAQNHYEQEGIFGRCLMDAYRENDDCDHGPYLSAGSTVHHQMMRAG